MTFKLACLTLNTDGERERERERRSKRRTEGGRERILQIPDQLGACVAAVITFLWGWTVWVGGLSDSIAM